MNALGPNRPQWFGNKWHSLSMVAATLILAFHSHPALVVEGASYVRATSRVTRGTANAATESKGGRIHLLYERNDGLNTISDVVQSPERILIDDKKKTKAEKAAAKESKRQEKIRKEKLKNLKKDIQKGDATHSPSSIPTATATTTSPSTRPSSSPTKSPSHSPTKEPTNVPTKEPTTSSQLPVNYNTLDPVSFGFSVAVQRDLTLEDVTKTNSKPALLSTANNNSKEEASKNRVLSVAIESAISLILRVKLDSKLYRLDEREKRHLMIETTDYPDSHNGHRSLVKGHVLFSPETIDERNTPVFIMSELMPFEWRHYQLSYSLQKSTRMQESGQALPESLEEIHAEMIAAVEEGVNDGMIKEILAQEDSRVLDVALWGGEIAASQQIMQQLKAEYPELMDAIRNEIKSEEGSSSGTAIRIVGIFMLLVTVSVAIILHKSGSWRRARREKIEHWGVKLGDESAVNSFLNASRTEISIPFTPSKKVNTSISGTFETEGDSPESSATFRDHEEGNKEKEVLDEELKKCLHFPSPDKSLVSPDGDVSPITSECVRDNEDSTNQRDVCHMSEQEPGEASQGFEDEFNTNLGGTSPSPPANEIV